MNNPFENPAFEIAQLTDAINVVPLQYGRIGELDIFRDRPLAVRTAIVEYNNGVLNLLPTQPVGSPGTLGTIGKREVRSFAVPHIPHDDAVLPEEVQGIREFGTNDQLRSLVRVMNDKLVTMARKHDITLEHLRAGALNGVVRDSDGSVLLDLFAEFGVVQKSIAMNFGVDDPRLKGLEVHNHMEDNLLGETMSAVRALCSEGFWNALIGNAEIKAAWDRWQDGAWLRQDPRQAFEYAGIQWEQYRGKASDPDGVVRKFVTDDEAIAFPMGTMQTFLNFFAPADFNETANTIALPRYAKQETRRFDRGTDIHTQSNPLPIVTRPALLVKLTL